MGHFLMETWEEYKIEVEINDKNASERQQTFLECIFASKSVCSLCQ